MDYIMYNMRESINIDDCRLMNIGFNQQEIAQLCMVTVESLLQTHYSHMVITMNKPKDLCICIIYVLVKLI